MANGDETIISFGPFNGSTRRIVTVAAGTTAIDLVPSTTQKRAHLDFALLKISAACDLAIVESGTSKELIRFDASAGETIRIDQADDIKAAGIGTSLTLTRSGSAAVDGYIIRH